MKKLMFVVLAALIAASAWFVTLQAQTVYSPALVLSCSVCEVDGIAAYATGLDPEKFYSIALDGSSISAYVHPTAAGEMTLGVTVSAPGAYTMQILEADRIKSAHVPWPRGEAVPVGNIVPFTVVE